MIPVGAQSAAGYPDEPTEVTASRAVATVPGMTVPAVEAVEAVVREWHDEEGWGVLDCAQTPGGCWAGFSAVGIDGYRRLSAGQRVWLEWETAEQDGFTFRAVRTWPYDAAAQRADFSR